jgi:hypothetical protein
MTDDPLLETRDERTVIIRPEQLIKHVSEKLNVASKLAGEVNLKVLSRAQILTMLECSRAATSALQVLDDWRLKNPLS